MKKILILTSIVVTLIFSGCAQIIPNKPTPKTTFKFVKVHNSETLYKATYTKGEKISFVYFFISGAIKNIITEVKKRGYNYFQIVSPKSISNLDGFPITNGKDLASFLNPQMTMPSEGLNFLETRKTLMDNNNSQSVVDIPLTIFQDTKLELVVRLVKEPLEDEIVWDVNKK